MDDLAPFAVSAPREEDFDGDQTNIKGKLGREPIGCDAAISQIETERKATMSEKIDAINALHSEVEGAMKKATAPAIEAGKQLQSLKASKKFGSHGQWLPFLKNAGFAFKERTAQNYMKLYRYSKKHSEVLEMGLFEAYVASGIYPDPAKPGKGTIQNLRELLGITAKELEDALKNIPRGEHAVIRQGDTVIIRPMAYSIAAIIAAISSDPMSIDGSKSIIISKGE